MTRDSAYGAYRSFYARWGPLIALVQGTIVVAISIILLVIGLSVASQANAEHVRRLREHVTVREACVRAQRFGPPFIAFIDGTQRRLGFTAVSGQELSFYRSTIPASCPK